ncbi:TetR-like C-terminal domain-containing protein [Streptomyces sp. NPDC058611]|uniref:TetR-like C-terminal domain-containing protein n=1 Tax=unclassified Streptomyces TaxID=2593676 RepID=UPI00364E8988
MRDIVHSFAGQALRSVLHECDRAYAERFHEVVRSGLHEPAQRLIGELVERGIKRGDVRADAMGPFVVDVIPAVMTYRTKVCGSEREDRDI